MEQRRRDSAQGHEGVGVVERRRPGLHVREPGQGGQRRGRRRRGGPDTPLGQGDDHRRRDEDQPRLPHQGSQDQGQPLQPRRRRADREHPSRDQRGQGDVHGHPLQRHDGGGQQEEGRAPERRPAEARGQPRAPVGAEQDGDQHDGAIGGIDPGAATAGKRPRQQRDQDPPVAEPRRVHVIGDAAAHQRVVGDVVVDLAVEAVGAREEMDVLGRELGRGPVALAGVEEGGPVAGVGEVDEQRLGGQGQRGGQARDGEGARPGH